MIVPIEANYFNNFQINKQSLSRQLNIKQENMNSLRWHSVAGGGGWHKAKIVLKYNFTLRQANLVPIVRKPYATSFPEPT